MRRDQPTAPDGEDRPKGADGSSGAHPAGYLPVHLAVMQPGTMAPVDLYIQGGPPAGPILYKSAQDELREEMRERPLPHGVQMLYIRESDKDTYQQYVERNLSAIIRDDLMPDDRAAELIYEISSRVMKDTFRELRASRNLQRAQSMVEATVMSIMKHPQSLWEMTSMASHDYYTYTHCVTVSMFLIGASQELLGVQAESGLRRIGLGGIFHDIGKSQIPAGILNKRDKLTAEEFERIKEHPALGLELIAEQRSLSSVAAAIVRSHHERYDGSGYPDGVAAEGLREVVRLSTIIDVYAALATERCYAPARSPFAALQLMVNDMPGHFDPDLLRQFVAFLGPGHAGGRPLDAVRVAPSDDQ